MERARAKDIFRIADAQARRFLHLAQSMNMMPNRQLAYVLDARDQLYTSCALFNEAHVEEEHADLFLPLFDSLAFITCGVRHKRPVQEIVGMVFCVLDSVSPPAQIGVAV